MCFLYIKYMYALYLFYFKYIIILYKGGQQFFTIYFLLVLHVMYIILIYYILYVLLSWWSKHLMKSLAEPTNRIWHFLHKSKVYNILICIIYVWILKTTVHYFLWIDDMRAIYIIYINTLKITNRHAIFNIIL